MANFQPIVVTDYETGGKNANLCQAMSMACIVIDPVRLEILQHGDFYSLIKANWDEDWCKANNVEIPSQEALDITKLTKEENLKAPSWQEVHTRFEQHVKKFWTGNSVWKAPLFAGFNCDYDMTILTRACKQWGSYDKEYQKQALFHPIHVIDMMRIFHILVENRKGWFSVSLDNIRRALGIELTNNHNALTDCRHTGALLIRWLKWYRASNKSMKLEDSFKGIDIMDFYDRKPE